MLESLIKAGAMDQLGRRAQLMAVLDKAMERAQKTQRDASLGQHGLFGVFDDEPHASGRSLPNSPDWDERTRLQNEKEILGFFITGHPLEKYKDKIADFRAKNTAELLEMTNSTAKGKEIPLPAS